MNRDARRNDSSNNNENLFRILFLAVSVLSSVALAVLVVIWIVW
ncbi:hypothetical protein N0M98_21470 [Paenibacillus doosanensis]|uniref:Uncharacterized protein n=1 Tax=Paenibacillus konkukensis TaxID=2020716 RepID=A0ABY4RJU5_9BACL|nr:MULTISPECIES: hypothetical protein [Paenibacillus]MCS7462696.1 hypothetical protein [Paenibacillus doosanensis]UQZ82310.1 hypothetical protein SK3146_01467 [Paenibacillus konkukensis]